MIMMAKGKVCWMVAVVCFAVISGANGVIPDHSPHLPKTPKPTCQQLCTELNIKNGCQRPTSFPLKEVIVMTNGGTSIFSWQWDTITMVVNTYSVGKAKAGLASCMAHSKGKRYGLREPVPAILVDIAGNFQKIQKDFIARITTYQQLLLADHMVFDLLLFFRQLQVEKLPDEKKSTAIANMADILSAAVKELHKNHKSDVFCVVPWEPPCLQLNCSLVKKLLANCQFLLLSPDSFMPTPDKNGQCRAQATVPISKFLYGVDRYLSLRIQPNVQASIVAGIPWHGYTYKCHHFDGNTCMVNSTSSGKCFDSSNRRRHSLSEIHNMNMPNAQVRMDEVTKGLYYTKNSTAQMWFENFTTLYIKYHLVEDLGLKGLSLWYGEDLAMGMSTSDVKFSSYAWDFMTHQVLHHTVQNPTKRTHVHADTVAGIAVGCLLLGTVLGVVFTCIALRRNNFRRLNRPFKLDEVEDEFRDDEGL